MVKYIDIEAAKEAESMRFYCRNLCKLEPEECPHETCTARDDVGSFPSAKTKVYLAGSCGQEQRMLMKRIAEILRGENYIVYCPFELKIPNAWEMSQEDWAWEVFQKDVDALDVCDVFLMITPGRISTAGTNWEQGYCYAKGKRIVVLQYTHDNTSLMSFCGSDVFLNTDISSIEDDVVTALLESSDKRKKCGTTLT